MATRRFHRVCLAILAVEATMGFGISQAQTFPHWKTAWGSIDGDSKGMAMYVRQWPEKGGLPLPTPFPNITRAWLSTTAGNLPLIVRYNTDATEIRIDEPASIQRDKPAVIRLEIADKSHQSADGRIILTALDAEVHGTHAKLETHPGNHRIGYWTDPKDFVTWNYTATRSGRYDVFLTYSTESDDGTQATVEIGDQKLDATLKKTEGGWYGYTWLKLGKATIAKEGPLTVAVRCRKMVGIAVMNLKAVTLVPTCEGTPPVQASDGSITLNARDATIHGVKLRYESRPEKNTIGFWTEQADCVSWSFTVNKPGEFDVEVLQGCGKGQGGSDVQIDCAQSKLAFKVVDSGGFQKFIARKVGTLKSVGTGQQGVLVSATNKAGQAVMDLRQIRLVPHVADK